MDEGQMGSVLRVPDAELEFGPDLVVNYRGQPSTGVSYGLMDDSTRGELTYVNDLQQGLARDWDAPGRLRAEDFWRANFRHGRSRTYEASGAVVSESKGGTTTGTWMLRPRRVSAGSAVVRRRGKNALSYAADSAQVGAQGAIAG